MLGRLKAEKEEQWLRIHERSRSHYSNWQGTE